MHYTIADDFTIGTLSELARIGTQLVNESGTNLNQIVEGVKKVARIIEEISAASQEQARGLEQVSVAVSKMDEVAQQNSGMVSLALATLKM